jgi:uncharacterized protein
MRSSVKFVSSYSRWLWSFVILAFSMYPVVASPSFDCRNASKPDEQAICGSAELSVLESAMSEKFTSARTTGDVNKIRDLARELLKQRRNCKADIVCIRDVLAKGITLFGSQQSNQSEAMPAQTNKQSTFDVELKEETPQERCDIGACNKSCIDTYRADYEAVGVAVCQDMCGEQRQYCTAHDGGGIDFPDIAPSSMGKLMYLFCVKKYQRAVELGVKSDCDKIRAQ